MALRPDESRPFHSLCLDCMAPLAGEYCHVCGQRNIDPKASLFIVLREFVEETFEFDGRLPRTLVPFFFKPGHLAREYLAGRRKRYTSPVRLYIFAALVSFFVLSHVAQLSVGQDGIQIDNAGVHLGPGGADEESTGSGEHSRNDREDAEAGDRRVHFEGDVDERLMRLEGMDSQAAGAMLTKDFFGWAPFGTAGLIFVLAFLLKLFYFRTPFLTHLVGSTHIHAFSLLLVSAAVATRHGGLVIGALVLIQVYVAVALWRVYERSLVVTAAKYLGLTMVYGTTALFALAAVSAAALMLG